MTHRNMEMRHFEMDMLGNDIINVTCAQPSNDIGNLKKQNTVFVLGGGGGADGMGVSHHMLSGFVPCFPIQDHSLSSPTCTSVVPRGQGSNNANACIKEGGTNQEGIIE